MATVSKKTTDFIQAGHTEQSSMKVSLGSILTKNREIDERLETLCRLRAALEQNTCGQTMEDRVLQIVAMEESIHRMLEELYAEKQGVQMLISRLQDPRQRTLLRLRYLAGKTWLEIARVLGYKWAQTHRIHKMALEKLESLTTLENSGEPVGRIPADPF